MECRIDMEKAIPETELEAQTIGRHHISIIIEITHVEQLRERRETVLPTRFDIRRGVVELA
jgi:hypothetical protein